MVGLITWTCLGAVLYATVTLVRDLRTNIAKVKKTGVPYMIGLFTPTGYFFLFLAEVVGPIGRAIPILNRWGWLYLIDRQVSWSHPREAEDKWGDTFFIVTPFSIYLKTSSAELNSQVTTRKTDFLKPVEGYKIVDLFGRSILTQEGQEWKRHRKIVGPGFSEKSNRLVFEESLRQTEGMMGLWASQQKSSKGELKVENTAIGAATLSLHVICAAGFGVPQLWPQEGEEKLLGNGVPGFSEHEAKGAHTLTFKDGLNQLLKNLMWFVMLPKPLLKASPFKAHQAAYQGFTECMTYFHELLDIKKKQMYLGESDKGTMDLLGPMIKANEESTASTTKTLQAPTLTTAEILGNCFIFLFAGHETTANNIHYTVLELAMNPQIQKRVQADIDTIIGPAKPISEWSYHEDMPKLYNSMVGATMSESLRLIPAICNVPKITAGDQTVTIDGHKFTVPDQTFLQLNVVGTNRNPRYWGDDSSAFRPERWLPKSGGSVEHAAVKENGHVEIEKVEADGLEKTSFETSTSSSLITPVKGSYISFSEGTRACPGRRFAQVESTAVLSALFQKHSVELDVSDLASEEEVEKMGREERKNVYDKARRRAEGVVRRSEQLITLQMRGGDRVPVVFRRRGEERFLGLYD